MAKIDFQIDTAPIDFQIDFQEEKPRGRFAGFGKEVLGYAKEAGKDVYKEAISPFVHGSSTLALGVPKATAGITGMKEALFPEQESVIGKAQRLGWEITGFTLGGAVRGGRFLLAAAKKGIPKLAGKGLTRTAARGAIVGVGTGLLQTPEAGEGIARPRERLGQAKTFGVAGALPPFMAKGGKFVTGVLTKTGRWVARNIGGVSNATVNIIRRLGADRVFDPAKARIDYIGKEITPKAQKRIIKAVTDFTPKSKNILKEVGMKPDEIATLNSVDKNTLKKLQSLFGEEWDDIQMGLQGIKRNADLQFKTVLSKQPKNKTIDIKNTYFRLKNLLTKEGWIDAQGNEKIGAGVANKTKTNLIKIFKDLQPGVTGIKGKPISGVGKINITEYYNKLNELEASLGAQPKFDRLVYQMQRSLRRDAVKGIPGLAKANKMYSDALKLSELEGAFGKLDNMVKLESKLLSLKNIAKPQLHNQYRTVLGKDLYDDLLAHLANQDFELISDLPMPQGGFYPSRAGVIKAGVAGAAKKYYKDIAPKIQPLKEAAEKLGYKLEEIVK